MADNIERTIYKLEIDDSGYIRGVESLSASTNKFAQIQEQANQRLRTNEAALKSNADIIEKNRKALENYTGTNVKYRQQLERDLKNSEAQQVKLNNLVTDSRVKYEQATKAAQDFANTTQRANNLQTTPGARITGLPPSPVQLPNFNLANQGELLDIIQNTTSEFEQLAAAMQLAENRLASLDEESEEFKELFPIVEQGRVVLDQYRQAAEQAAGGQQSLRTQIRLGKEELVRLEEQGKGNTREYIELEKRVARLTDAFSDQQARIRILASDTKLLDFGKGAITAATSAFQAYTAVSILAGDESAELQKKTMQLFAAMQLLQSLEQLSNLTRREGVLATLAQSAAQSTYTTVVGASTGALRAFRIALVATGIGAAIAALTFLVIKFNELGKASKEAAAEQKALTEIGQEAASSFAAEVTHLELIKDALNDLSTPQKERVKLAKEYNKTADEGNKIDLKQIDNIKLVNAAIDTQIEKIKERAFARAAEVVIAQKAEEVFRIQAEIAAKSPEVGIDERAATSRLQREQKTLDDRAKNLIANRAKILEIKPITTGEVLALSGLSDEQIETGAKNSDKLKILQDTAVRNEIRNINIRKQQIATEGQGLNAELRELFDKLNAAQTDLDASLKFGKDFITIDSLIKPTQPGKSSVENVFIQERDKLLASLAALRNDEVESIQKINDEFAAKLVVEQNRIAGLLKDKKITPEQKEILLKIAADVNQTELDKALADFNKKVTDARNKLNDELRDLQNQNIEDSLNLLRGEFERRKALIDFNEKEAIAQAQENQEDRLAALELDRGLIGEQAYQDARAVIVTQGEQEINNITGRFARDRQDLAADIFKNSLDLLSAVLDEQLLQLDENTAGKIQEQKRLLATGAINYEQFQKAITQILKNEKEVRDKLRLEELQTELKQINDRLETVTDAEERAELLKRQRQVRGGIAEIQSQTTEVIDPNSERVETVASYAQAIGELADSVIQFWVAANEAESAALDRSISLQERRVEAAQRIAERGNASYLKAEEDRLRELTIKRENAARRDLAINAALQASQLLVGITGAIAKIATPGIGIAETIGAIAVIFSSLATGYGLVKSLQGNQPTFAEGTTYVSRGKNPRGKDTIPAWLDEGEAVTSAKKNKEYHPTIKAIHEGTIPASDLNRFVTHYHKIKPIPQPNYTRIKEAAEMKTNSDGRLAVELNEQNRLIKENNDLQRTTIRTLKSMGVNVNMDKNGIAVSVMEAVNEINRDRKI